MLEADDRRNRQVNETSAESAPKRWQVRPPFAPGFRDPHDIFKLTIQLQLIFDLYLNIINNN